MLINEQKKAIAALGYRTPVEFENHIKGLSQNLRPKVVLYDFNSGKNTWGIFNGIYNRKYLSENKLV